MTTWATLADGLQALAEAHTLVEQHEERWWEAEVHRLRGVLLLQQARDAAGGAETWLQRAWTSPAASRPSPWNCAPP